jgi:hypothetical protein
MRLFSNGPDSLNDKPGIVLRILWERIGTPPQNCFAQTMVRFKTCGSKNHDKIRQRENRHLFFFCHQSAAIFSSSSFQQ